MNTRAEAATEFGPDRERGLPRLAACAAGVVAIMAGGVGRRVGILHVDLSKRSSAAAGGTLGGCLPKPRSVFLLWSRQRALGLPAALPPPDRGGAAKPRPAGGTSREVHGIQGSGERRREALIRPQWPPVQLFISLKTRLSPLAGPRILLAGLAAFTGRQLGL